MRDGDEERASAAEASAAAVHAADTAPVSFPPANCPKHREYLRRRAEDSLRVAGVCLAHLLDATEGEPGADSDGRAALRDAAHLTVGAVEKLAGRCWPPTSCPPVGAGSSSAAPIPDPDACP